MAEVSLATLADLGAYAQKTELTPGVEWTNFTGSLVNGWTGSVRAAKWGPVIFFAFFNLNGAAATDAVFLDVPVGWRPPSTIVTGGVAVTNGTIFVDGPTLRGTQVASLAGTRWHYTMWMTA